MPIDPTTPLPEVRLDQLVPEPLHIDFTPIGRALAENSGAPTAVNERRNRLVADRSSSALPVIDNDTLIINDGSSVTAWDRFTLRRLWQAPGGADAPSAASLNRLRQSGRSVDDASTLTVAGRVVLAATSENSNPRSSPTSRLFAFDRDTGQTIWSIDPAVFDERLEGALVRGPVSVEGDTVVVAMRKSVRARRLVSLTMLGVSLRDGAVRWITPIGSAGALPYEPRSGLVEGNAIADGVSYRADELGLVAAVDVEHGRPLWIRRLPGHSSTGTRNSVPWRLNVPLIRGDDLILLSPDRENVLRIGRATGEIKGRRQTTNLSRPEYIFAVENTLICMGRDKAALIDIDEFELARPVYTPRYGGGGAIGRAVAAGTSILVPVSSGTAVFDINAPAHVNVMRLDVPGAIALADGQIAVYDRGIVSSYLSWEIASDLLGRRIKQRPSDPDPATTLAELAFRADRESDILPAMDAANAAIEKLAPTERRVHADRLFAALLNMIETSLAVWTQRGESGATLIVREGDDDEPEITSIDNPGLLDRLVRELGALAVAPRQIVAFHLADGRLRALREEPAAAIAAYQRVLSDSELAAASWRGNGSTVRAELEAGRRVRDLIEESGLSLYERFEAEAVARLDALGSDADAEALTDVARGYPLALASVTAWRRAAETHLDRESPLDALRAIDRGLAAAEQLTRLGGEPDTETIGELAGRRVTLLAEQDRPEDAAAALLGAERRFGAITLTAGGTPIDTDTLRARFDAQLAAARALPKIGEPLIETRPQLISGYVLQPLGFATRIDGAPGRVGTKGALIVSADASRLSYVAATAGENGLAPQWSREITIEPLLLRVDAETAILVWPDPGRTVFERLEITTGETIWRTEPWADFVRGEGLAGDIDREQDATRNLVRGNGLIFALDRRTLAVAERGGVTVTIDTATGKPLWAAELPIAQVADIDVRGGMLAIAGSSPQGDGAWLGVDTRTGEPLVSETSGGAPVIWTRVTSSGQVIFGTGNRVASYDPLQRRENWSITGIDAGRSQQAWLLGDELLLRTTSGDGQFFLADAVSGRPGRALDDLRRIQTRGSLRVLPSGEGLLLAGESALLGYDREGHLLGSDAIETVGSLVPPVLTDASVVTIESTARGFGLRGPRHRLHVFDRADVRLQRSISLRLLGEPQAINAIDGHLLVSAADSVLVIRCPVAGEEDGPDALP
ncbi:MAG: PQQ-binding-like beta-propeller repeat protein [Planctomycetota bacterium]